MSIKTADYQADWSFMSPEAREEFEQMVSAEATAYKASKVGVNNNGVAAVLGYTLAVMSRLTGIVSPSDYGL